MTTIAAACRDIDTLRADLIEAECRIADLNDSGTYLLAENARLRRGTRRRPQPGRRRHRTHQQWTADTMSDDIIERAEAALKSDCLDSSLAVFVPPLVAALKAARADNERMGRKHRLIELILFTTERKLSYAEMDELDDLHKEFVK